MEIRKWSTVDIHYNADEQKSADKMIKYMKKLGYRLEARDDGSDYDFCDQYMTDSKVKFK